MRSTSAKMGRRQQRLEAILSYRRHPFFQVTATTVASLIALFIFGIFAIQPSLIRIVSLQKEIKASQETLQKLEEKSKTLENIQAKWQNIATKIPAVELAIPFGPEYPKFHKQLAYLAYENDVKIVSVNTGEAVVYMQSSDPYKKEIASEAIKLPIVIRMSGSYTGLISYLKSLMLFDRVVEIENVSLLPEVSKENKEKSLVLNVSGNTYYMANNTLLQGILELDKQKKGKSNDVEE